MKLLRKAQDLMLFLLNEQENTICYNMLKFYISTVQTSGHLQLFLVQFVQICTCFLLHCVRTFVLETAAVGHSLHNYLIRF